MQELSTVLTTLSVVAGLALGVERILEVLKHIMEFDNDFLHGQERDFALKHTKAIINRAENAFIALNRQSEVGTTPEPVNGSEQHELPASANVRRTSTLNISALSASNQAVPADTILLPADAESDEKFPAPRIPVIAATTQSRFLTAKRVFLQLAAAGLGIIFAYIFDLRLLSAFLDGYGVIASEVVLSLDVVFTGIVIGGGSQPIHLLIRFIAERSVRLEKPGLGSQAQSSLSLEGRITAPLTNTAATWHDIDYRGGVQPERLDRTHLRPANPNLIVYHHTAMASSKTFQNIVDEFLVNKKWLTGYHCVIMPDGGIRPFCRWDRAGNHAKGLNARSLGIAFHGNFHTEPTDKYANTDGRYGNQAPTEAQLLAGAQVVALWASLYDGIRLDFENCILAHREAIPDHTVCPGSNFPVAKFQRLICDYHESWLESKTAQQRINMFKQLNYVYAT
ncbi:MAG: N-acetylmuramoyl-L-alanine amidase [Gammaproteobacteria bacterium]|nr:N-acetylmuramoyl-L-alanine amidase [Gammaproteobacteria bacterium]